MGRDIDWFKFLKNSISSNKFNKIPRDKKINIALRIIFKNFIIMYLLTILYIRFFLQELNFYRAKDM